MLRSLKKRSMQQQMFTNLKKDRQHVSTQNFNDQVYMGNPSCISIILSINIDDLRLVI
jgi:hypothetical protein